MTDHLLAEVADGIGTIVFNNPERRNAVSREMANALGEAVQRFERDPAVRCVVIRGAGDHFTAGGDVKNFHRDATADHAGYAAAMEQRIMNGHMAMHRLRRMPKPVIVAVQGMAVGLGVSLLCCADLAVAADDAQFALAYRHIGLSVDGGVSYFLPRMVGERLAMQITLMGERFDAAQALDWHLVNWVVPRAQLEERTQAIARNLADGAGVALGHAKTLLRQSLESTWDQQSAAEARLLGVSAASADHLEGITAFIEKRRPQFTGK